MSDERLHPFWERGDRDGYIEEAQRIHRSASGGLVIKPVASRWFNLNTILMTTSGDLWIHREKGRLWWTYSTDASPDRELIKDPEWPAGDRRIFVYYKPCLPWSNRATNGAPLLWDALHPKAQDFLFTEGTFQQPASDHAAYVQTLVVGGDLSAWHERPEWTAVAHMAKRGAVTVFNARQRTIARMARAAMDAALQSNTASVSVAKHKEFRFPDPFSLEKHIDELIRSQEGLCALTGIALLFDDDEPVDLRCSLDRIDSDGHYERGNLQVVCRFVNQWKGASDNSRFISLIEKVRVAGACA